MWEGFSYTLFPSCVGILHPAKVTDAVALKGAWVSDVKTTGKTPDGFRRYRVRSPKGAECATISICKRGAGGTYRAQETAPLAATQPAS